jgi:hypothetical protein
MTPTEALQAAALAGRLNQFEISSHALQRMRQRNVTLRDIRLALGSATTAIHEAGTRWRLEGGRDDDGDALDLVVVFNGRVLVVTVF